MNGKLRAFLLVAGLGGAGVALVLFIQFQKISAPAEYGFA